MRKFCDILGSEIYQGDLVIYADSDRGSMVVGIALDIVNGLVIFSRLREDLGEWTVSSKYDRVRYPFRLLRMSQGQINRLPHNAKSALTKRFRSYQETGK